MSVTVVPMARIDLLVNAGLHYSLIDCPADAGEVGAMLWEENYRSVNRHYGEANETARYTATVVADRFHPVAVLKAVESYLYQIVEPWDSDPAHAYEWCRALRAAVETDLTPDDLSVIRATTGEAIPAYQRSTVYEQAPWWIDSLDDVPRADRPTPQERRDDRHSWT